MAENSEERSRDDLTEEASPFKLEEFRRKGMVAQSREVTAIAVLLAAAVTGYAMAPSIGQSYAEFMREVFRTDLSSRLDLGSSKIAGIYLVKALQLMISMALPICGAGFIIGVLGSFAQIGAIFTFEPLTPDFAKVNPLQGVKRLFSMKQAIEALRLVFKMIVVLTVTYYLLKDQILASSRFLGEDIRLIIPALGEISRTVFFTLLIVLAVFAGIDLGLQKFEYQKNLRMTKQEAKQEFKEREGDPQIRARIRAVQREMARKRMMQAVKKADVIITNPTHIAIAIVYDKNSMAAPRVVAKGADLIAQKIKEIAKEAGVPLVENVPLARTLFKTVKIGQYIPRALYQAVAEVLAYVYRLKARNT